MKQVFRFVPFRHAVHARTACAAPQEKIQFPQKRFAPEQCLNSVYNLRTVIFRKPSTCIPQRCAGETSNRRLVGSAEENSEIRNELRDCTSRLESNHYGHEKVQDPGCPGPGVGHFSDCITTVDLGASVQNHPAWVLLSTRRPKIVQAHCHRQLGHESWGAKTKLRRKSSTSFTGPQSIRLTSQTPPLNAPIRHATALLYCVLPSR